MAKMAHVWDTETGSTVAVPAKLLRLRAMLGFVGERTDHEILRAHILKKARPPLRSYCNMVVRASSERTAGRLPCRRCLRRYIDEVKFNTGKEPRDANANG